MPPVGRLWPSGNDVDDDDGGGTDVDGDDGNHDADDTLAERGREIPNKETKNDSKIKGTGLQAVLRRRV